MFNITDPVLHLADEEVKLIYDYIITPNKPYQLLEPYNDYEENFEQEDEDIMQLRELFSNIIYTKIEKPYILDSMLEIGIVINSPNQFKVQMSYAHDLNASYIVHYDDNKVFSVSDYRLYCDEDIYREQGWTEEQIKNMHSPCLNSMIGYQTKPLSLETIDLDKLENRHWYRQRIPNDSFSKHIPSSTRQWSVATDSLEPYELDVIKFIENYYLEKGYTLPVFDDQQSEVKCTRIDVFRLHNRTDYFKWCYIIDFVYAGPVRIKLEISQPLIPSEVLQNFFDEHDETVPE